MPRSGRKALRRVEMRAGGANEVRRVMPRKLANFATSCLGRSSGMASADGWMVPPKFAHFVRIERGHRGRAEPRQERSSTAEKPQPHEPSVVSVETPLAGGFFDRDHLADGQVQGTNLISQASPGDAEHLGGDRLIAAGFAQHAHEQVSLDHFQGLGVQVVA